MFGDEISGNPSAFDWSVGALTAFNLSPAQRTTAGSGKTVHDDIVVFEVITETLERLLESLADSPR
jgi:hypothetical protein